MLKNANKRKAKPNLKKMQKMDEWEQWANAREVKQYDTRKRKAEDAKYTSICV